MASESVWNGKIKMQQLFPSYFLPVCGKFARCGEQTTSLLTCEYIYHPSSLKKNMKGMPGYSGESRLVCVVWFLKIKACTIGSTLMFIYDEKPECCPCDSVLSTGHYGQYYCYLYSFSEHRRQFPKCIQKINWERY